MKQFHGYRIKSTNIGIVESTLRAAKANLAEAAKEEYHRLLSEEVAELVDDIAMNICQRPGVPLLDVAVDSLNRRISHAETVGTGTEYDLRSGVSIIPDKGYTYLLLTVSNRALEPAFSDTTGIEDYTVGLGQNAENTEIQAARGKKWERLYKRTEDAPIILTAGLTSVMSVDTSILTFIDKKTRAGIRARRTLTSRLLNQYACGGEIKSDQLMALLDKALERILSEDMEAELAGLTERLNSILPDITLEMVTHDPRSPVMEPHAQGMGEKNNN